MNITHHTVERLEDPFGLLPGERYEFRLYAEVEEEDELYTEAGIYIRVLYIITDGRDMIKHYHIHKRSSDDILDFELEEEELDMILEYCRSHKDHEGTIAE
ncbi:DUF6509 family protein [Bacillus xiapuensis]|uniref:DUF6509 family protein n=1 Tax=Bacillus xiapuensis TaxID=2014075 RepID=UPI000C23D43B|nr:DUF6509 family protein [Bacillus xiapuensis]